MDNKYKVGDIVVGLENKNVSGFNFSKGEVYTIVEMTSYDFGLKGISEYKRYCTKDTLDEYFTKEPNDPVNETEFKLGDKFIGNMTGTGSSNGKVIKGFVYELTEIDSKDNGGVLYLLENFEEDEQWWFTEEELILLFTKVGEEETKLEPTSVLEEQKEEQYTVEMKNGRLIVANLTEDEYEEVKKTLEDCAFVQINHYLIPCEDIAMIIEGEELC